MQSKREREREAEEGKGWPACVRLKGHVPYGSDMEQKRLAIMHFQLKLQKQKPGEDTNLKMETNVSPSLVTHRS